MEQGMTVVEIPDTLRAAMVERAIPLQTEFVTRVPAAAQIVDAFKAAK